MVAVVASATVNDNLHFVFELTRHGARAPTGQSTGYTIEEGELTPQGMRQRYLLGKHNRQRYVDDYELLDGGVYGASEEMLLASTLVNRTMQSMYSELMGMFPPTVNDPALRLTPAQQHALQPKGLASPPFKIRDQAGMSDLALPQGFMQIPVYTHLLADMDDDLDLGGCGYVNKVDGYRFPAESTYANVEFLKDDLRAPISAAFNLTQEESKNMSFMTLYGKCDVIQSNIFEGLGPGYNYT